MTLGRICAAVDELIEETRSLSFGLSNSVLYEVGLKEALESFLIKEIRPEHELAHQVEARGDLSALDNDLRCILYRNVRELVINVVKHAQARHVRVDLDMARDQITVRVEDDGLGFDLVAAEAGRLKDGHLGLFSVREYVEALGGSLKIASKPDHGTCVTLKVPIHYAERE